METEINVGIKEKLAQKESFLNAKLVSGTDLFSSDPDKSNNYIKGVVPKEAAIRVLFSFKDKKKSFGKGSSFVDCSVNKIQDVENKNNESLEVGVDQFWILRNGSHVFVNKSSLGYKMAHIKEKKRPEFKQTSITNFPKIRKTR